MSTKFGIRIAPRKRPWICKSLARASCPPPVTNVLTATFKLRRETIPPPEPTYTGTLLLNQIPGTNEYEGIWEDFANNYSLKFFYPTTNPAERPEAGWVLGPTADIGTYTWVPSSLLTPLRYYAASVQTWPDYWFATLLVTA